MPRATAPAPARRPGEEPVPLPPRRPARAPAATAAAHAALLPADGGAACLLEAYVPARSRIARPRPPMHSRCTTPPRPTAAWPAPPRSSTTPPPVPSTGAPAPRVPPLARTAGPPSTSPTRPAPPELAHQPPRRCPSLEKLLTTPRSDTGRRTPASRPRRRPTTHAKNPPAKQPRARTPSRLEPLAGATNGAVSPAPPWQAAIPRPLVRQRVGTCRPPIASPWPEPLAPPCLPSPSRCYHGLRTLHGQRHALHVSPPRTPRAVPARQPTLTWPTAESSGAGPAGHTLRLGWRPRAPPRLPAPAGPTAPRCWPQR